VDEGGIECDGGARLRVRYHGMTLDPALHWKIGLGGGEARKGKGGDGEVWSANRHGNEYIDWSSSERLPRVRDANVENCRRLASAVDGLVNTWFYPCSFVFICGQFVHSGKSILATDEHR
jgi:hypothetical protein